MQAGPLNISFICLPNTVFVIKLLDFLDTSLQHLQEPANLMSPDLSFHQWFTTYHVMRILSLLDHWSLNAPVHGVVRNSWCFVQLSLNVTRFCHHQPLDICHHHILNIWFHQQILTIYQNHFVIVTTMVATLQIIKGLLNMVHTTILNKNKLPSDAVLNWVFACSWCTGDNVSIICLVIDHGARYDTEQD